MTSKEVAALLGLSGQRVRQAAPLYAVKHGRDWWWNEEAVDKLRERMGRHDKRSQ